MSEKPKMPERYTLVRKTEAVYGEAVDEDYSTVGMKIYCNGEDSCPTIMIGYGHAKTLRPTEELSAWLRAAADFVDDMKRRASEPNPSDARPERIGGK